jgi:hypothetical protein
MGIWQLINIFLFWIFFGCLTSYIAQKKGRNPKLWFLSGLLLGLFGVVLIYMMPAIALKPKFKAKPRTERSEAWMKMWYYTDPQTREQKGPMEFPDLAKDWKNKMLNDSSLVWGEGMQQWKQLAELPDVKKEMETTQK